MLKKIKTSIDSITKSSNDVLARFDAIDSGVRTVSEHELHIRNTMEEQEVGGRQILESISRLREITSSVKNSAGNMTESGEELNKKTHEFISISDQVVKGMNEIVSGAMSEIEVAVNHVNEMSAENDKNFTELKQETEKFKVSTGDERKTVLIIDDSKTVLTSTRGLLKEIYEVITASSGKEALNLFYGGLVPNYILLDLKMPDIDGWYTYERMMSINKLHDVPTAIFTSSNDPRDKERAQKIGAIDYINKTATKEELLKKIAMNIKN
jgi:CheY-like chemotaxis protein